MTTTSDKSGILKAMSQDRALASAMLFPHRHPQASPPFHVTMMDSWRASDELMYTECFRGGAKTTLVEENTLIEALFGNFKYMLIFGETYTKACQRIAAIKHELANNLKIINLFGKQTSKELTWNENTIVLPNGVCIEAHGWEEEIRGYKFLTYRPDRALLDDIENKTMVKDTASVDATWRKIHLELIPAMDLVNHKLRVVGTPLGDDCLAVRAHNSPNWVSLKFPICDRDIDDPEAQSIWPSRIPIAKIKTMRDQFAQDGMLREFMQEYMLVASGSQGKPFEEEMLRFEDVAPNHYAAKHVIIDPARTVEVKKSDQTGYVVVSKVGSRIYVHESDGCYWQPDEIVQGAYDLSKKHDECEVSIEKNSLDDWLLQPMRAKGLQLGRALKLKTLQAPQDRDKAQFIMGLQSFFRAGDIIFVGGRVKHAKLISQLLNFPTGKKDILNALAYTLRVFSGSPVYADFGQANIAHGAELNRAATLVLACNSQGPDTTAVLCAIEAGYLTVLADWVSPLVPADAIPDILMLIRAVYPGKPVTAWVPADVFDQIGRNPLVAALKQAGISPKRGEYAAMGRGSLSPMIRTEVRGRRMFKVDSNAVHTLQALSSGYNWPVKSGGERAAEPERGAARTLIEGLEVLTYAMGRNDTSALTDRANAVNANGTPYMSALGKHGR